MVGSSRLTVEPFNHTFLSFNHTILGLVRVVCRPRITRLADNRLRLSGKRGWLKDSTMWLQDAGTCRKGSTAPLDSKRAYRDNTPMLKQAKRAWHRSCPGQKSVGLRTSSQPTCCVKLQKAFYIPTRPLNACDNVPLSVNSSSPPIGTPWAIRLAGTWCFLASSPIK